MSKIMTIASGVDVMPLVLQVERNPELWDEWTLRTEATDSPHHTSSDIWLRYNDKANFNGDKAEFNGEHDSVWYPAAQKLPALRDIVFNLMARVRGERLGGIWVTKIPPGKSVLPHVDGGWHAGHYDKYAVQLKSAPGQSFNFEGERLESKPGDVYWFDNSYAHWVLNDSDQERMTLIVCIKGE